MILRAGLLLLITCTILRAGLPFALPPEAEYSVSEEAVTQARTNLAFSLVGKPGPLTNLFASPMMCGPGLWRLLKNSPHFVRAPTATSSTKISVNGGKSSLAPLALLQNEEEVGSFRKALAEILASQGKLTIREPTKEEFMAFWSAIQMNTITGPLLTAEGKDLTLFCHFENGKVLWADEVKRGRK